VLLALLSCGCGPAAPSRDALVLATTTSVANSELLDVLIAAFTERTGLRIRTHLVGSGLALRMLEKGDADAAITHAPAAEAAWLRRHPHWRYRKFMFNDFVIVGPRDDPASAGRAGSAAEAMRRIAQANVRFISRGDGSGTHEREQQLWDQAGARPPRERLVGAGSGMGTTLRVASDTAAYTLTDRATLAQLAPSLQLAIVFEGGADLLNTYAVTVDPSRDAAGNAGRFFDWLVGNEGRAVIESFTINGMAAFSAWPPE
jgi:tungstate transport system substrate-binding protein